MDIKPRWCWSENSAAPCPSCVCSRNTALLTPKNDLAECCVIRSTSVTCCGLRMFRYTRTKRTCAIHICASTARTPGSRMISLGYRLTPFVALVEVPLNYLHAKPSRFALDMILAYLTAWALKWGRLGLGALTEDFSAGRLPWSCDYAYHSLLLHNVEPLTSVTKHLK